MAAPSSSLSDGRSPPPARRRRPAAKLAYFVHDLNDAAVHRRARMLRGSFPDLALVGFRRGARHVAAAPAAPDGLAATELGRTADGRFARRAGAVLREAALLDRRRGVLAGTEIFLARQLETLALAAWARRRFAPEAALAYECLDVHRLMVSRGAAGAALRALERRLLERCDLLVVSSPAFVAEHFAKRYRRLPPVHLLENKVLSSEAAEAPPLGGARGPPPGPPWRIGWFGVIRCRRSLALLAGVAARFPGLVEVVVRGRPARDAVPGFDATVASTPGLSFGGPYDRGRDLGALYSGVHFTWTMDFYEAGANSDWLLPNRLYEGGLHGAVALALRSVETGRWLAARGAGVLLDEPLEATLPAFLEGLDPDRYRRARAAAARIRQSDLVLDEPAAAAFAAALAGCAATRQRLGGARHARG